MAAATTAATAIVPAAVTAMMATRTTTVRRTLSHVSFLFSVSFTLLSRVSKLAAHRFALS
jgi:hypothetical protein